MINSRLNIKINNESDIKELKRKPYKSGAPWLCTTCKRVWQHTNNFTYIEYVVDFPKYGCTKRVCRECEQPKGETK